MLILYKIYACIFLVIQEAFMLKYINIIMLIYSWN
jgi:hypothetical protein